MPATITKWVVLTLVFLTTHCKSILCIDKGNTGLEITAGQRTMSGLIVDLTGQTFVLPVMLTGQNSIVFASLFLPFTIAFFIAFNQNNS